MFCDAQWYAKDSHNCPLQNEDGILILLIGIASYLTAHAIQTDAPTQVKAISSIECANVTVGGNSETFYRMWYYG